VATYPAAAVVVSAFEAWPGEHAAFDLVTSATAFHWIDPAVGYLKITGILKPTGALAVFENAPVRVPEVQGFVHAVQAVYQRAAPALAR